MLSRGHNSFSRFAHLSEIIRYIRTNNGVQQSYRVYKPKDSTFPSHVPCYFYSSFVLLFSTQTLSLQDATFRTLFYFLTLMYWFYFSSWYVIKMIKRSKPSASELIGYIQWRNYWRAWGALVPPIWQLCPSTCTPIWNFEIGKNYRIKYSC